LFPRWLAVLWVILGFALGGSFVATLSPPNQQPNIAAADTRTDAGTNKYEPPKTWGQKLSIIWDRTWGDPVAFYTFVLSIFTAFLAVISAVQIAFLFRTDRTTKITAEAAALHAKAAVAVELPILFIDIFQLWFGPGVTGHVAHPMPDTVRPKIRFKNIGHTAAELTNFCINWVVALRLPETPNYRAIFRFAPGTLLTRDGSYFCPTSAKK
jgi:hypothetical protein